MHEPPYRIKNMMPGMIMMWAHSIETIPSGWHLCDGTMGTPDLTCRFVRGAGGECAVGYRGGYNIHTHPFTGDGHSHTIPEGTGLAAGTDRDTETESDPAVGTTDSTDNRPPFENLCFIMKL